MNKWLSFSQEFHEKLSYGAQARAMTTMTSLIG